jgi:small GTP-binding protein
MSMNAAPSSERFHIGFFGSMNSGKSSIVNAVTGQDLSVVSDVKGTTTDPVYKAMELLPAGPVVIIDTPGFDDEGALGGLRVQKTRKALNRTDLAVLVIDSAVGMTSKDEELINLFREKGIDYLIVWNKADMTGYEENIVSVAGAGTRYGTERSEARTGHGAALSGYGTVSDTGIEAVNGTGTETGHKTGEPVKNREIRVSAKTGYNIHELKEMIAAFATRQEPKCRLVGDIIEPGDFVVLVVPIDRAAPKGRLILPQQQAIRDILDTGATAIVVKETELEDTLAKLGKKPDLVVTDSQVFGKVASIVPGDIPLTSFSILFARYRGGLDAAVKSAKTLSTLQDGDTILISEGCTHHRQCDDIGTVKLPRWIREFTKKDFNFMFTSGTEFPDDLSGVKLVVHCGGCMLNEREMTYRRKSAQDQDVPMTNYGVLIAYLRGILDRCIAVFRNDQA